VVYQDLERDADIGTQYAKRVAGPSSAVHSQNEATFDLPLMLTAAEAKGIALRQLHSAWLERTGYEWRLPWTHVDLEPAESAGTLATAGSGAETFAAGDRLAIINQNPADATLADLSITFLGKRT
jgi:hypothetical protein